MEKHKGQKIYYIDQNGNRRWVEFIEWVDGLIQWRKGYPLSTAARYYLDDGSIVQIPEDAWDLPRLQIYQETHEKSQSL